MLPRARQSAPPSARPRTGVCICCRSGSHLGESPGTRRCSSCLSITQEHEKKCAWMFHSMQLGCSCGLPKLQHVCVHLLAPIGR